MLYHSDMFQAAKHLLSPPHFSNMVFFCKVQFSATPEINLFTKQTRLTSLVAHVPGGMSLALLTRYINISGKHFKMNQ
jgi:hypothetical protein